MQVQDGAQDGRFWWRAGGAPVAVVAPARAHWRQVPIAVPARGLSVDRNQRRVVLAPSRWAGMVTAGMACACVVVLGAAVLVRNGADLSAIPRDLEQATSYVGLALEQVSVSGHRHTSDSAIFDALMLDDSRSLLAFDGRAAKDRLEQLPWIEQANVTRLLPGGIDVSVVERTPAAVWKMTDAASHRHVLLDRTGRTLGPTVAGQNPSLPLIEGEGADKALAELLQLEAFTSIASSVARIERVGQRRWTLHLTNRTQIFLPSAGEAAAIAILQTLAKAGLDPKIAVLDLRLPGRMTLRYDESRRTAQAGHGPVEPGILTADAATNRNSGSAP